MLIKITQDNLGHAELRNITVLLLSGAYANMIPI